MAKQKCETRSLADLVDYCPWCLTPAEKRPRRAAGVILECKRCGAVAEVVNVFDASSFPLWRRAPRPSIDARMVSVDAEGASCSIESRTRAGHWHRMRLNMNGTMSCTCESWTKASDDAYRKECWALKDFKRYWRDNKLASRVRGLRRQPEPMTNGGPGLTRQVTSI